jgi:hypothetical protein
VFLNGATTGRISQSQFTRIARSASNADRYWEAKLAPGHVPSDAYVHSSIRIRGAS